MAKISEKPTPNWKHERAVVAVGLGRETLDYYSSYTSYAPEYIIPGIHLVPNIRDIYSDYV